MTNLDNFATKKELFDFMVENKSKLIAEKSYDVKKADAVSYYVPVYDEKETSTKQQLSVEELLNKDKINAKLVINTTNLMDSHSDVHIKGLWNKSLKEQKELLLVQEHEVKFSHIISDKVKAQVKTFDWAELGYNLKGTTEALVFNVEIEKTRNKFMFEQYAKGYVKQHSVGMRYVKLELCINSDEYQKEKESWDKYIDEVANRKVAEERGYFWAVTEAKIVEGSAVPLGSNYATPTLEIKSDEPLQDTQKDIEDSRSIDTIRQALKEVLTN